MITPAVRIEDSLAKREQAYQDLIEQITAILESEDDWVAAMATVSCELHHSFEYFHWTGFYRVVAAETMKVGPYQGGHGCLLIPFSRGVCGAAARTQKTQLLDDVEQFSDHIACSSTTVSELVVPVLDREGQTMAVIDIDSDLPAAFKGCDQKAIEELARYLGQKYG